MNSTSNSDFFNPLRLVWLALALCAAPAWAQFKVDVTGVGMTQLPIAIAPFRGEDLAPQKSAAIVLADLERSGQFRGVDSAGLSLDESSRPDMSNVRQRNADALLAGSVQRLADGRYEVRARLWDTVKGQERGDYKESVNAADLRLSAHRLADCGWPTPMARMPNRPWPAPSRSSRPLGHPRAINWPMCHLNRANR